MKNIIVGIDFSNSAMTAMRHAVAIAIRSNAALHLVWVKAPGVSNNMTENDKPRCRNGPICASKRLPNVW